MRTIGIAAAIWATIETAASAQAAPALARMAFTGPYAGVEIGAHEHHFYVERTTIASGEPVGRYYRAWGIGGGAFAGYDLAIARRIRIGVEAGVSLGGATPAYAPADGTIYARKPVWGLRGTLRAGYLVGRDTLVYGTFGYGAHHYRVTNTVGIIDQETGALDHQSWPSSFTIGAGVEQRLSRNVSMRLDFRHLDNAMSQVLIGVPIRF